jgi:hypothetical protein
MDNLLKLHIYSIFGIAVDRKQILKWLFPQEKATFYGSQKVYTYSENALVTMPIDIHHLCAGQTAGVLLLSTKSVRSKQQGDSSALPFGNAFASSEAAASVM